MENFIVDFSHVMKKIINEVIKECNKQKVQVDENLVSYVANVMSLDPNHGLHSSSKIDKNLKENFIGKVVEKFLGIFMSFINKFYKIK